MGKKLAPPQGTAAPVTTCGKVIEWNHCGPSTDFDCNQPGGDIADWPMITFDGPVREGDLP